MLDDFREWLSDYLRYFMLGGAVLLVVLVVIFAFRACSGCGKEKQDNEPQQTIQQDDGSTGEEEDPVEDEPEITNPLLPANEDITELATKYYKALGDKDVEALQSVVTELSPEDEAKILNVASYIEGYKMGDVYTKQGMDDKSYVVYVCYSFLISDIETPVPVMSAVYAVEDEDGKVLIDSSVNQNKEITDYMDELLKDADISELAANVQKAYDDAQEADPALAEFLAGLGSEESDTSTDSADGTILVVTEGCNVRDEASSDGDVIGGYDEGVEVEKLGAEGEWIKIEYEGQTGYIHESLLAEKE